MATRRETVEFILGQAAAAGTVSARKMFGEYGLYCDGKIVGLVCDDQLFIKPTDAGRVSIDGLRFAERAPYPGAKPCLLIPGDRWDDGDWLASLIRQTADALPAPKPRKKRPASRKRKK